MYLVAIINIYSRYIVSWGLSNTLDADSSFEIKWSAVATHGKGEIPQQLSSSH